MVHTATSRPLLCLITSVPSVPFSLSVSLVVALLFFGCRKRVDVVRGMGMDWEPWPPLQRKSNHVFVKLLVLVLLLGLSFRLLFSRSAVFLPVSESPAAVAETASSTAVVFGVVGDAEPREGAGSFARQI